MNRRKTEKSPLRAIFAAAIVATACGDDEDNNGLGVLNGVAIPAQYAFLNAGGESTVNYDGQTVRHLLIDDLKTHLSELTARIDNASLVPTPGQVAAELDFFYRFDSDTSGMIAHSYATDPGPLQSTYNDVSSGKDLSGKIAGNDVVGQHRDWNTELVGWDQTGVTNPESLVDTWFAAIDQLAVSRANGTIPTDPDGTPITEVFVDAEGRDYQQLLQKFLLGAIAYSQGTDDYLDDDTEGKGLLSDHTAPVEGKTYTALEHAWDEAFGYFGAARDYNDYSDDEIAAKDGREEYASGYHDTNSDGAIDLTRELNWGHSVNAAKRDRGSAFAAPTNMTTVAWNNFVTGRALIASLSSNPAGEELNTLRALRNTANFAWESAIAATVIHYINEVLQDMNAFGTTEYSFLEHAKHWSEMKGFALSLQFNPRKRLLDDQFASLHTAMGQSPVLSNASAADIDAYRQALLGARLTIQGAFGFSIQNAGDENGENGW